MADMTQNKPLKTPLTVTIGANGREWLNGMADTHLVSKSDVVRAALSVAAKHQSEVEARLLVIADN